MKTTKRKKGIAFKPLVSSREFLMDLREAATDEAKQIQKIKGNQYWIRAYQSLADAADRLDSMLSRSTWNEVN